MKSLVDWFTNYCISNALISKDNEAWFRYGLEKRICTWVVLIPFTFIALVAQHTMNTSGLLLQVHIFRPFTTQHVMALLKHCTNGAIAATTAWVLPAINVRVVLTLAAVLIFPPNIRL